MNFKKIPFTDIKELLGRIFKASRPVEILPDPIHTAALTSGIELEWNHSDWWDQFELDDDELSDEEILSLLFEEHKPIQGNVIIVTDECFKLKEGYILPVQDLLNFIENIYPEIHHMGFFQPSDTIFIHPDDCVITIMNHEGYRMQYRWG